jgi:N6-adenosine-specific RNA methylase IME4
MSDDDQADNTALVELRAANSAQGQAIAYIYTAGHTLGAGLLQLKWLLQDDRWRRCGFDTVETFADSIKFAASLKPAVEARKELAVLFAAAKLSSRKIAKVLNVGKDTVNRDLGANAPPGNKKAKQNKGGKNVSGANAPPAMLDGERAAKLVSNKAETYETKQAKRDAREQELAGKILALPDKKYGVIYADPEWRFEFWSADGAAWSSPDNHYATSALDVIKARDVPSIAADDCALFLCATVPMLPQALEVMAAWGFEYKTSWVWVKDKPGNGYWSRNQHEILLLGTRGNVPAPIQGPKSSSVIEAPVGEHSEKPTAFYELIEGFFPTLPKIELNARKGRDGWEAWGAEAPAEAAE